MQVELGTQSSSSVSIPEGLRYIVVAGADRMPLNGFIKYFRDIFGPKWPTGNMHSLMSAESCGDFLSGFMSKFDKGLLAYYARRKINIPDPLLIIPESIKAKADMILWFELYSTEPVVLKDMNAGFTSWLMSGWKKRLGVPS